MNDVFKDFDFSKLKVPGVSPEDTTAKPTTTDEHVVSEGTTQPTEKIDETKPTEKKEQSTSDTEQPAELPDYLSKINELVGGEFKSDDDIKTYWSSLNEKASNTDKYVQELNQAKLKSKVLDEVEKYINENQANVDPLNTHFGGNKENMRRYIVGEQLIKSGMNPNLVGRLVGADFDKMDSLELLSLDRQAKSQRAAKLGNDATMRSILKSMGAEEVENLGDYRNSLTPEQLSDLDFKADEIANSLRKTIDSVKLPETPNFVQDILGKINARNESVQQAMDVWSDKGIQDKLANALDKVDFSDKGIDFAYEIDSKDKAQLLQKMIRDAANHQLELNDDNIKTLVEAAKYDYAFVNMVRMFTAYAGQRDAKNKEQRMKETYNGSQINTNTAPVKEEKSSIQKQAGAWQKFLESRKVI